MTRTTVAVGGIVATDAAGADIGAQARFARANARGGVAGRTIKYSNVGATPRGRPPGLGARSRPRGGRRARHRGARAGRDARSSAPRRPPVGRPTASGSGSSARRPSLQTRVVSPAWGAQLRSLLGTAQGSQVALVVDADELGSARCGAGPPLAARGRVHGGGAGHAARRRLRCRPISRRSRRRSRPARPLRCCSSRHRRRPRPSRGPADGAGVHRHGGDVRRVLPADHAGGRPTASPCSCRTRPSSSRPRRTGAWRPTSRRSPPGTKLTPGDRGGVLVGRRCSSAVLAKVGKRLTRARFVAAAQRSSFSVPGTVGRSTWPRDALPGRALRRAGAERRLAVPRRRALPMRGADRRHHADDEEADCELAVSRRRRDGTRPSSSPGTTRSRRRSSRHGCR